MQSVLLWEAIIYEMSYFNVQMVMAAGILMGKRLGGKNNQKEGIDTTKSQNDKT